MPKYEVHIDITGTETYEVEAANEEEAVKKALRAEVDHTATETNSVENGSHEVHLIE